MISSSPDCSRVGKKHLPSRRKGLWTPAQQLPDAGIAAAATEIMTQKGVCLWPVVTIDYRCEDGRFLVYESCGDDFKSAIRFSAVKQGLILE
jgi:hypothetical protein